MADVGVLGGTGKQGRGLALRLARAGLTVVVGSREAARAQERADQLRADVDALAAQGGQPAGDITGGTYAEAAGSDVAVVAVPYQGLDAAVEPVADVLAGRVVVSVMNALAFDEQGPHPLPVPEGSVAERLQRLAPDARVVGAFQNVAAGKLLAAPDPVDSDVLVSGDDAGARAAAARLVTLIPGMRAVDVGPLRLSRPVEEITAVQIAVNRSSRTLTGLRLTGLPDDAPATS